MTPQFSSLKPDVTLSLSLPSSTASGINGAIDDALTPEDRRIKLIQLLLTCATHAASGNLHRADACLRRISQFTSVTGDSMHRLATWFASALAVRLVKRWPGVYKALHYSGRSATPDLRRARCIFAEALPYMGFAYAVINRTLIEALIEERMIHIVDLGSGDPKSWVPFIRILAVSPNGPPHLKFTCVSSDKTTLDNLGANLTKEAGKFDMPFQFNPINVHLRDLNVNSMIEVRSGEALAFVSVLNFHVVLAEDDHIDAQFGLNKNANHIKCCKGADEFLAKLRSLSPKLVMLVEQESDHNLQKLLDRFVQGLRYYSAFFESIDVTFGKDLCEERMLVEEMIGKEIENIVACDGLEREERHEKFEKWAFRMGRAGFRPVRLWGEVMEDAMKLVYSYGGDGYKISSQRASLMICWHDRPIYSVSGWTCFNSNPL